MAAYSRLRTAIDDGLLHLPDGAVHVMRPPVGFDLSALAGHPVSLSHTNAVESQAWSGAGYDVSTTAVAAPTICVVLPRSKALARSMIAQAARLGGLVIVDGGKTDGIDSLFKAVRKTIGDVPSVTKAHGRMFWFDGKDSFADWAAPAPARADHGFYTTAGVFSEGAIDKGSALLVAALPDKLKGRVADFGAGWGYLAEAILQRADIKHLDLIEAEALALECARLNITNGRAAFHWADETTFKAETPYDTVIMNPPFHQGRAGDPSLGQAFITAAARNLKPQGHLWMVANRHLPYEAHLQATFKEVSEVNGNAAFKIFHASRPQR